MMNDKLVGAIWVVAMAAWLGVLLASVAIVLNWRLFSDRMVMAATCYVVMANIGAWAYVLFRW